MRGESIQVLVMEDNEVLAGIYRKIFMEDPWKITVVEDGKRAIDSFKERWTEGEPFDAVILDLDINGDRTAGLKVFEELKRVDPSVRAILCSGSIDRTVDEKSQAIGFRATLRKPFTCTSLQNIVCAVLSGA